MLRNQQHIFILSFWFFIYGLFHLSAISQHRKTPNLAMGANFRIYPSNVTQTETFITRHPVNSNILFATANTINLNTGFISEGIYVSTNAGLDWYGSDTCKGSLISAHRGDPGIAIDKNGNFILIRLGFSPGLFSHYSTNNGLTWSAQKTVAGEDQDRAALTSDGSSISNYYGRTYATWVQFAPPYPMLFSFTDDGAQNWSVPTQINNPAQRGQGGDIAIEANGKVNVCWSAVTSTSPYTEDYVGFASSTNGGTNWFIKENAFDINGIAGVLSQKGNIRVNGLPRIGVDKSGGMRNGWMYIVTTQKNLAPAGSDPDIILNRSTDGGTTWSAGVRVNRDAVNTGKIQYFPAIHVDDFGGINIIFYDDRNTTSDSTGVFLSRSTDGGNSWNEYEISDHNFKPVPIGGLGQGYQGDNIGLTSSGNFLNPVWMDNSTGIYQIWTCQIDITKLDGIVINNPPNQPSNPIPENNALNISISTYISWICTDPDGDSLIYDIYLGTTIDPPLVKDSSINNTFIPTSLSHSTKYYWKIVAKDDSGATSMGDIWNFTTEPLNIFHVYRLEQNYPNPFNPATTIAYELKRNGFVSLKVFDIFGREIASLVNETKKIGKYEVNWNGVNFSSGCYFYRLTTSSGSLTRPMILLK